MSLSITDVARRADIPTSTLRYYDRLGLLSSTGRADNGYRQYDDRALDRLQFIARAKELGCSLDEIAMLLGTFDDDCGDVQGTLRELVVGKIEAAQRRSAEMVALTAQLQQARHALNSEARSGPCGPDCACLEEARSAGEPSAVQLAQLNPAVACTLDHSEMDGRISDWHSVLRGVEHRTALDGGVRLNFGPEVDVAELARLAQAEWACCSFFSFAITVDDRGTALEIRAPEDGQELVQSVFGAAS